MRSTNTRDERIQIVDKNKILFSFKDFDHSQPHNSPKTLNVWEEKKLLSQLFKKLQFLSNKSFIEAKQEGLITEYNIYPEKSDFECPKKFIDGARWAVIKKVTGQKARIVGHIVDNVFYLVFLDKDHRFWITEKKNT